jgi:hypothetical protein
MKKEYVIPQMRIIRLINNPSILYGSTFNVSSPTDELDGDYAL